MTKMKKERVGGKNNRNVSSRVKSKIETKQAGKSDEMERERLNKKNLKLSQLIHLVYLYENG